MPSTPQRTEIRTSRLLLRGARKEDLHAYHKCFSDPESMNYWSHGPYTSIEQTVPWVDGMISGPWNGVLDFSVCVVNTSPETDDNPEEPTCIGKVGLYDGAEIGFLLDRGHWGKGYASEAIEALLKHAWTVDLAAVGPTETEPPGTAEDGQAASSLKKARLDVIKADVDPRNFASLRVLKKHGFVEVGSALRTYETHLGWCDSVYLELKRPKEDVDL